MMTSDVRQRLIELLPRLRRFAMVPLALAGAFGIAGSLAFAHHAGSPELRAPARAPSMPGGSVPAPVAASASASARVGRVGNRRKYVASVPLRKARRVKRGGICRRCRSFIGDVGCPKQLLPRWERRASHRSVFQRPPFIVQFFNQPTFPSQNIDCLARRPQPADEFLAGDSLD